MSNVLVPDFLATNIYSRFDTEQ